LRQPVGADHAVHLHAVDRVAHAQQRGGAQGRQARAAARDDADEGELRAAGEHEQAQRHGLPHGKACRHGQGANEMP
jgi:hypothetical protein